MSATYIYIYIYILYVYVYTYIYIYIYDMCSSKETVRFGSVRF